MACILLCYLVTVVQSVSVNTFEHVPETLRRFTHAAFTDSYNVTSFIYMTACLSMRILFDVSFSRAYNDAILTVASISVSSGALRGDGVHR